MVMLTGNKTGPTGSLARPLLSRLTALRCPGCPRPAVRLYVAVGLLTTVQWDTLGSIFPEAWAGGRVQVQHHQDGQGRGALRVGMGIDRHGATQCVRQLLFFFFLCPGAAAKGQGGRHAIGVMRTVLMASSSSSSPPLLVLLLCHELRVQAQVRAPSLDRMLPVVP